MSLKLLMVGCGLFLGYLGTIRRDRDRSLLRLALALLTFGGVLLIAVGIAADLALIRHAELFAAWQPLLDRLLAIATALSVVPLDAFLIGLLVGYLTADQQNGAERRVGEVLAANAQTVQADTGLLARLFAAARANGVTIVSVLLVLLVLLPMGSVFGQLSSAEAFGVKIALKQDDVSGVAQAQRTATPTRDSSNELVSPSDNAGFTQRRLRVLHDLTATLEADGADRPWAAPIRYIFGKPTLAKRPDAPVYRLVRDRAMISRMLGVGGDQDTRSATKSEETYLASLGAEQQKVLIALRPQVACLDDLVGRSRDNRLVVFQNLLVVQDLLELARHWTAMEFGSSKAPDPSVKVSFPAVWGEDHLKELLLNLSGSAGGFGFRSMLHSRTWDERGWDTGVYAPLPTCVSNGVAFEDIALRRQLDSGGGDTARFAQTPYLVIFAATVLAASDDHGAAVNLLGQWLTQLDHRVANGHGPVQTATAAAIAADWYGLTMAVEILLAQKQSDRSPNARPVRRAGYRELLENRFPRVLKHLAVDPQNLKDWMVGSSTCREEKHRWKQSVVDAYIGWSKDYLEFLNTRPDTTVTERELRSADILLKVNVECFADVLESPGDRARQRLQLTLAAAITRFRWASLDDMAVRQREASLALLRETKIALDFAVASVPPATRRGGGEAKRDGLSEEVRRLVEAESDEELLGLARNLQRTLASAVLQR